MASRPRYTAKQYETIRAGLTAYQKRYGHGSHAVANAIADATGFPLKNDAGRKRVERLISGTHRVSDDFVSAVDSFLLGQNYPEELLVRAKALSALSSLTRMTEVNPHSLTGIFHGSMRGLLTKKLAPDLKLDAGDTWQIKASSHIYIPLIFSISSVDKSPALIVKEATGRLGQSSPPQDMTPEKAQPYPNQGVATIFGSRGIMAITRSFSEVTYYHLDIALKEPLTLQGYCRKDGIYPDSDLRAYAPFSPDYQVELTRVSEINQ